MDLPDLLREAVLALLDDEFVEESEIRSLEDAAVLLQKLGINTLDELSDALHG